MRGRVAIDSGPLVALFDKDDTHHQRAVSFLKQLKSRLVSNLAVLTEVSYLLDFSVEAQKDFLRWVCGGGVTVVEVTNEDLERVVSLLEIYADLPADFADASLIAICERLGIHEIATVDRDFSIYRLKGKRAFKNIFPLR